MNSEELALRQLHPLYAMWEDAEDVYSDHEYDPYAEADALYEQMGDR